MGQRLLLFGSAVAAASALGAVVPQPSDAVVRSLIVAVGERASADVDFALGYACDDTSILRAWMTTEKGHNWFVVDGLARGHTWCRVGMVPGIASYLFEVTVVSPKPRDNTSPPR